MNMRACHLWAAAVLFGLVCASTTLHAADCAISTTGINFTNAYDPTANTAVTGNGSISVNCSGTGLDFLFGFKVATSLSQGSSDTYVNRTLKKGTEALYYNLYTNPALATVFGDGTAGTANYSICYPGLFAGCGVPTGTSGQPFTVTVYGQLPGGQDVSAGAYSDSLTATITF